MGRIIGIGGKLAAGKDTVADYLVSQGWVKFGMSDPLHESMLQLNPIVASDVQIVYEDHFGYKEHAAIQTDYRDATEHYGYTAAKEEFPEYRRLLQAFGTEVGRSLFGESVWVDIMKRRVSAAAEGGHDVVVTGIRFPNEVDAIKELRGELWWVTRNGHSTTDGHASETSVSADDFDIVILNNGDFDDLYDEVDNYR